MLRPRADGSEPLVIIGAGRAGTNLVRSIVRSPDSPYRPVVLLDDDPNERQLHFGGIRVVGTASDVLPIVRRFGARAVLIAVPSATNERLKEMAGIRCSTPASRCCCRRPWRVRSATI